MLGGGSNENTMSPVLEEGNPVEKDSVLLPQLKLFGHVPIVRGADATNNMGNKNALAASDPIERVRKGEPVSRKKELHLSLNNNFPYNDVQHSGNFLNPNPVSTGLRLSSQEERNSCVIPVGENMRSNAPGILSLGHSVKLEIDRQAKELDRYIKHEAQKLLNGVRELNQRHTVSILNALEIGVNVKLHEKEHELEIINCKNKELADRIQKVAAETQSWRYWAKYNESVANLLKSNIHQLMAQGHAQAREGSGENEVDDAVSSMRPVSGSGNQASLDHHRKCRVCNGKEVSAVLLPCRHLCLCIDCEGVVNVCPICQVMKTASVQVYMP